MGCELLVEVGLVYSYVFHNKIWGDNLSSTVYSQFLFLNSCLRIWYLLITICIACELVSLLGALRSQKPYKIGKNLRTLPTCIMDAKYVRLPMTRMNFGFLV